VHKRRQADQEQVAPADERQQPSGDEAGQHAAARQQRGDQRADPTALVGWDEFLHQRQVDREDAGIADANKDPEEYQEQPARDYRIRSRCEHHDAGRQRDRHRRPDEYGAPADVVAEPAADQGARHGAEPRSQEDRAALPIGQRPLLGQRRGDVSDQKKVEEIEQVCNISRANQLPLIGRQLLLPLQNFDHGRLP